MEDADLVVVPLDEAERDFVLGYTALTIMGLISTNGPSAFAIFIFVLMMINGTGHAY